MGGIPQKKEQVSQATTLAKEKASAAALMASGLKNRLSAKLASTKSSSAASIEEEQKEEKN